MREKVIIVLIAVSAIVVIVVAELVTHDSLQWATGVTDRIDALELRIEKLEQQSDGD